MTAVYYEGNGRFSVGECDVVDPGPGEVRVRVAYCGICGTDVHIAHGAMAHRLRPPQVIGHEASGVVDEVGPAVTEWAVGDTVVVRPLDTRGETAADKGISHICRNVKFLGIDEPGAFQSFWTVPAFTLHRLPPGLDLRIAALTEPLAVATHDVRLAEVQPGDAVVVIGGGPIGLLVGLVAHKEKARVILSEPNDRRRLLAGTLGFDTVDPSEEDLGRYVEERTDGAGADVVFEVSGSPAGAAAMTTVAGLRGRVVVVAIFPEPTPISLFDVFWKELRVRGARVYEPQDYERAVALVAEEGASLERLITSMEPLDRLPEVFASLHNRPDDVKILVDCRA
jgi:(R,R)-butanediol dehydrogenase / meso-butanediol dehydrogenase / diacetyl reductase